MATHEYQWNTAVPSDLKKSGIGCIDIQDSKKMIGERFLVDHNLANILTQQSDQDGTHKQVTMKAKTVTPSNLAGAGKIYAKYFTIDGAQYIDLCYLPASGAEVKLTEKGVYRGIVSQKIRVSGSAAIALSAIVDTYLTFPTVDEKSPDTLSWVDNQTFTVDVPGVYMIYVSANIYAGTSRGDYATVKVMVSNAIAYQFSLNNDEGTDSRVIFLYLTNAQTVKVCAKTVASSQLYVGQRSMVITKV